MTIEPDRPAPRHARQIAGAIAGLTLLALLVQPTLGDASYPENALRLLQFFTIWSNIAAIVVMALIALGRPVARPVLAALATALTIVGLVYWALLAADHNPVGLDRLTNQVYHTITPAVFVAWWLRFTPPAPAILPALPVIMVPPLTYGLFALVLGELTGFYAYFFLDLPALGWFQFIISNVVLAAFFALMGAGLMAIKRALWRSS